MRYNKISLLVVIVLLFSVSVLAAGQAGTPYNFYSVEKCYGDIKVRIYPLTMSQYSLVDCILTPPNDWSCPCTKKLYILTSNNTINRFSALVQYYIDAPKNFTPSLDGKPTQEELYNDGLKRIYTIKDITIGPNTEISISDALSKNETINNILLFVIIGFGVIVFLFFVIIVIFWLFGENIRKWLGLAEDEKMTLGKILRKIFTREDIQRKTFVRESGKVLPSIKPVEKQPQIKNVSNTQDEIRKILEGLDK